MVKIRIVEIKVRLQLTLTLHIKVKIGRIHNCQDPPWNRLNWVRKEFWVYFVLALKVSLIFCAYYGNVRELSWTICSSAPGEIRGRSCRSVPSHVVIHTSLCLSPWSSAAATNSALVLPAVQFLHVTSFSPVSVAGRQWLQLTKYNVVNFLCRLLQFQFFVPLLVITNYIMELFIKVSLTT